MTLQALRVLPASDKLVLNIEHAQATGQRRYVGRNAIPAWELSDLPQDCPRHEASADLLNPGDRKMPHYAFPESGSPEVVPNIPYYRKCVAKGDLIPADEATARECGVAFISAPTKTAKNQK